MDGDLFANRTQGVVNKEAERRIDGIALIVFIIWPFAGVLLSFFRANRKMSLYIIGAFCLMFGWTFNPTNELLDSFRYAQEYRYFLMNPKFNYLNTIVQFFSSNSDVKDIYTATCYYLTSLLGGSIHILYLLFAFVFSYFTLKSLTFIVNLNTYKNDVVCLLLLFVFFYANSIFNINGARFWTAAWIGVYATFSILIADKRRFFLLLLLTPLVHGSFWLFVGFVVVAYLIKIKIKPLLILFIISFFFSELVLSNMDVLPIDRLPAFMQDWIWAYTESEAAMGKISGENIEDQPIYWKVLTNLPRYFELFLVVILSLHSPRFSGLSVRLLRFLLSYLIIVNIFVAIPSFVRFYFLVVPFLVYIWIMERNTLKQQNKVLLLVPFVFIYGTFQLIRFILSVNGPILFMPTSINIILSGLV